MLGLYEHILVVTRVIALNDEKADGRNREHLRGGAVRRELCSEAGAESKESDGRAGPARQ